MAWELAEIQLDGLWDCLRARETERKGVKQDPTTGFSRLISAGSSKDRDARQKFVLILKYRPFDNDDEDDKPSPNRSNFTGSVPGIN